VFDIHRVFLYTDYKLINKGKHMNDNDMEAIDKKINEVATDNLNGLKDSLNHMSADELRSEAKEMIEDCSKDEVKKVLKLLVSIAKKSFEDE
tara:strand:- start:227 stop:502 length:276 start_codon:yes stop_codon:yes gene_type:complete